MNTHIYSAKNIQRQTHKIDASGKILGRLATEIATILMGKTKPQFVRYLDMGDMVIVINASKIKVTGKKISQKKYVSHSGYPGGLKTENFDKMIDRKPEFIIEHAVKGMLPNNKLGKQMIRKLKVYAGEIH